MDDTPVWFITMDGNWSGKVSKLYTDNQKVQRDYEELMVLLEIDPLENTYSIQVITMAKAQLLGEYNGQK